jgi:hypothetical protein
LQIATSKVIKPDDGEKYFSVSMDYVLDPSEENLNLTLPSALGKVNSAMVMKYSFRQLVDASLTFLVTPAFVTQYNSKWALSHLFDSSTIIVWFCRKHANKTKKANKTKEKGSRKRKAKEITSIDEYEDSAVGQTMEPNVRLPKSPRKSATQSSPVSPYVLSDCLLIGCILVTCFSFPCRQTDQLPGSTDFQVGMQVTFDSAW